MSAFPFSTVETIIAGALPPLFDVLGIDAIHHRGETDTPTRILTNTTVEPIGEYGERVAPRFEIECRSSDGAAIGDTWTLEDGALWRADALLESDGLTMKFLAVDITADPVPDPDPDPETEPEPEP